jgi:hypothetical protein
MSNLRDFTAVLKRIASGPDGKDFVDYITNTYIRTSSLGPSPDITNYNLGQKELIQSWLNYIEAPEINIDIQTGDLDDY